MTAGVSSRGRISPPAKIMRDFGILRDFGGLSSHSPDQIYSRLVKFSTMHLPKEQKGKLHSYQ